MFNDNAIEFHQQKVADFKADIGIVNPEIAYRIRTDWDTEQDAFKLFEIFLNDPKLAQVSSIILGMWDTDAYDVAPQKMVDLIISNKDKLQHIKSIFFGDITYMECEISWITNLNHGPILDALPNLENYRVRGGSQLSLGNLNHPNLKTLIVETGGMAKNIFKEIANAQLPALEYLELWLGDDNYGFNATLEEVLMAHRGTGDNHLPALKYLGLRNSEIINEIAAALMNDPILNKLEILDLSKGTIDDKGAAALYNNPAIKSLKKLNLEHSYISNEWANKLNTLAIEIDLSNREADAAEDDRYVEVGE